MCGLAGIFCPRLDTDLNTLVSYIRGMSTALYHRGPNDSGEWIDASSGIAFGHRRLSILDLGATGRQPMISKSGRYVLCYNGEIYNYRELRKQLADDGSTFSSQTDTEVLLEAMDCWGVTTTLPRINGMFAFGLWDRSERCLYLARDAFGVKPIHVGFIGSALVFASELKAVRSVFSDLSISKNALTEYFKYGFISAPIAIYEGFSKLLPGTVLRYAAEESGIPDGFSAAPKVFGNSQFKSISMHTFWSYSKELERGEHLPCTMSETDAVIELDLMLKRVITRQRVADVPVGAFLSGGIDSSLVVAMLQSNTSSSTRTYTIGMENVQLDESRFARQVAKHLGSDHTELCISETEALAAARRVGRIYDEPFSDSSQIPTLLVAELAARDVRVVLTGDGGDEIFGGYNRHHHGVSLWKKIHSLPPSARLALLTWAKSDYLKGMNGVAGQLFSRFLPDLNHRSFENVRGKLGKIAISKSIRELYINLLSQSDAPRDYLIEIIEESQLPHAAANVIDEVRQLMYLDVTHYLPNDILTKVDRATMSCSLEARVPFLDRELVQFAASLPINYLVKGNSGKNLLKKVLRRYLPEELIDRPKMGFAIPLAEWLRGPLKEWSLNSLAKAESQSSDLIDWKIMRTEIDEFYQGHADTSARIWNFVMLGEWAQSQ